MNEEALKKLALKIGSESYQRGGEDIISSIKQTMRQMGMQSISIRFLDVALEAFRKADNEDKV